MSLEADFRSAVEAGDAAAVRDLHARRPELQELLDAPLFAFGSPALLSAAGRCQRDLVDALLDAGADPDARSDWAAGPYTALHRLVDGATPASLDLAEHLLARGATLDLHGAAGLGRTTVLATMLDAEPERVSEPGPDGATPLHLARDVETAELLLDRGAELDKRCVDHRSTPAQWALGDRPEVTRFLLDRGARADIFMAAVLDDVGLAGAILEEDPSAVEVRVWAGCSHEHLGHGDKYTWGLDFADRPLVAARRRGNRAVYDFLFGRTPPGLQLLEASRRGDEELARDLLSEHPDLIASLDDEVLCDALQGEPDVVRLLLESGADPNARDAGNGATALHWAAWKHRTDLVELLLEHGADPTIRDHAHASTPLGWADHAGHADLVEVLSGK